jgi:L-alanine-DL-glutamate epimerase-like enolase superfamily enzyme
MKPSDIRVLDVQTFKVPAACRAPLVFGSVVVESLPVAYAKATVVNRENRMTTGWGAMCLMDLWAWPASEASHETKSQVMCEILDAYARVVRQYRTFAHPIEIFMETEPELKRVAAEVCERLTGGEEIPFLGALVAASPVDHALHDGFGQAARIDSYRGYGPEHMSWDLSRYLGDAYSGMYPSQFLRTDYLARLPVFHLVGGLDVLREADVPADAPQDGIPNSLEKWIERDGVFCLKVKLCGTDIARDLARTEEVSRVYHEVRKAARPDLPESPHLTADTNGQCESPMYVVEYLSKLRERSPDVYREVLYIEQPTERDLTANRFDMGPVAQMKPVLVDESLTSAEDFHLAMELGWSGAAMKSCKGLSAGLLFIPMAETAGVPYAVQDLSNPSLALIESVGLAARSHTIMGVEANARQFFPAASEPEAAAHPGLYEIRDGYAYTSTMRGPGLGYQIERIGREMYR